MFEKITLQDYQKVADFINEYISPQFSAVLNEDEQKDLIYKESKETIQECIDRWEEFLVLNGWVDLQAVIVWKKKDENVIYLSQFYIHPDLQKTWLWTSLLSEFEAYCKNLWFTFLLLETQRKFYWAVNFYIKNGYVNLTNENLSNTYFSLFYSRLVEASVMFYKEL